MKIQLNTKRVLEGVMAWRQSVLDIILDLSLKLVVVFIATARLEINQESILVVEGKYFILFGVVDFKLALEFHWVASWVVVVLFRSMLLNADTVFL